MMSTATSTECTGCLRPFTMMRTGHSCRRCLSTFCHSCSSQKRPVPDKGYSEPVRVCDVCLHSVNHFSQMTCMSNSMLHRGKVEPSKSKFDSSLGSPYFADEATLRQRASHSDAMAALKQIYKAKLQPLEQAFKFAEFYDSELTDGDFAAKPFVLLIGGYSVGKTSFIRFLLQREDEIPGSRVGPEPTTDRFVAVMAGRPGQADTAVPGNAAAIDLDRPFSSLSRFGVSFLSRFQIAEISAPILENISFIDSPGVLSGTKQTVDRGYAFENIIEWFAARADRILLLFDAHKLDISDELKRVVETLKQHDDKIRVVLNKADGVSPQQLQRVYGALMWSLSKCIRAPEVPRVYIGSFWDKPFQTVGKPNEILFKAEMNDLLTDLKSLPQLSAVRKINEIVKRARLAKVHALLVTKLRNDMPMLWGHKKKQERLAMRLEDEYVRVQKAHGLALGDFPTPERFRAGLSAFDLSDFPALSKRLVDVADGALARDIPRLLASLGEDVRVEGSFGSNLEDFCASGNPFETSPQAPRSEIGAEDNEAQDSVPWAVGPSAQRRYIDMFQSLDPAGSPPSVNGGQVRNMMLESGLNASVLRNIWNLADIDGDGLLDQDEFAVAMQLIKLGRAEGGNEIPNELPQTFVPPSKR